jgi:hypothetical protein
MSTTTSLAVLGEHTPADWVTRDDMALLTRTSTDTVRRDVTRHGLETREDDTGRVLVNVGHHRATSLSS